MKCARYLLPLILVGIWQALCMLKVIPAQMLPSPFRILNGFKDLLVIGMPPGHLLLVHVLYSLCRVAWGFFAAVVLAIPLGLLMGWSHRAR